MILEAILFSLVKEFGAVAVRDSFESVMGHKTLRVVLSDAVIANDVDCLAGIRSYYDSCARSAEGLLYDPT